MKLEDGIATASKLGVDGIQIYAVDGRMAPWNISGNERIEIRKSIQDYGLEVSALCGDLGGHGFQVKEENLEKIEKSKQILALAKELGSNIVTTHIGIIPSNENSSIYENMLKACTQLEIIANEQDGYFAIETGCETAQELFSFLKKLGTKRICVNYDPANLVMVTGDDPIKGVDILKDYIVHTHAKDGVQHKKVDPKFVYGYPDFKPMSHMEISKMVTNGEYFEEMPLGKGSVDFPNYIKKLKSICYDSYLTIERELKTEPLKEISVAISYLKNIINID
jgi:sugar phosphate isomerase/epimerase